MTPVMTLTDGLWVAMMRCIPTALDSCASLVMAFSTSCGDTIIRSASSSMMATIYGSLSGMLLSWVSASPLLPPGVWYLV